VREAKQSTKGIFMKKGFVFFNVTLILICTCLSAQNNINYNKLDEYIRAAMADNNLPGLAIGIVKKDSVVFAKAYGTKNTLTGEELTVNSLFGIASLSKAFTAASIGILVDEGKVDWDDRVIDHLPWFKLYDPYATREIRIRDLLCHRSGLATFDGDLLWYGSNYSRREIVERISKMEPKNSFRYRYGYSNVMFVAAGELIEEVTGKTWDEFVIEKILKPLNMNFTTTSNSVFIEYTDVATPHLDKVPQPFINYDNCGPAASINSCVTDMTKWIKLWLNKGTIKDNTIFSTDVYRTITTSHTALSGGRGEEIGGRHFSNAALGWFLSDYAGRKIIAHGGGLPGYISSITLVPEDSLGIIVLTNDDSRLAGAITNKALDVFLTGKESDPAKDSYKKYKERVNSYWNHIKPVEKPIDNSLALSEYAGTYTDEMYGDASVELVNDELIFTMLPTKELFHGTLIHYNGDTFRVTLNDPFLPEGLVTFHFNSRGKIEKLTIDLPNPDFHFSNLEFIKLIK
jgi:CubicO group peptidase (beta-lactamase class C family)